MKLLMSQFVPKYAITSIPKDLKKEIKKSGIKLSKNSFFIDLREQPEDDISFAIVDKDNGVMILYMNGESFYLEEDEDEETCQGDQGVLIVVPGEGDDFVFDIIMLKMPPEVYKDIYGVQKFDVVRVFYYELPPYSYLYPLFYVRKMKDSEKKMWVKRISETLEIPIADDYICQAFIALDEAEIEKYLDALKKAAGVTSEEEEREE